MRMTTPTTREADKFLGFLAVTPNRKFMKLFERADVKNILISYHYIRKNKEFTQDILTELNSRGGLFMTDSGIFSFGNDKNFDFKKFDWVGYTEEYVEWLDQNKGKIFSAINMDADNFVRREDVLRWNEKFFEPLMKDTNIIYAAHPNCMGMGDLDGFKYYAKKYPYVAINERMVKHAGAIYQEAKIRKCAVHGLAWTKPAILRDFPFFSVDSSSWVNYQKYGATPVFDGTNFTQFDKDNKDIRKTLKGRCKDWDIKFYEFCYEKDEETGEHNDDEGLTYSIKTWLQVFESIKVQAKIKLSVKLGDLLKGKLLNFMEDKKDDKNVVKKSAFDNIGDRLASGGAEVEITDSTQTTYEEQEDGSLLPVYTKRNRSDIEEFIDRSGDVMVCDFCSIQEKCPKFQANSTCAFDFQTKQFLTDPLTVIDRLIQIQMERVNRAMMIEKMDGGQPNKVYSTELNLLNNLNMSKARMLEAINNPKIKITKSVEASGKGVLENTTIQTGGGFGDMLRDMLTQPIHKNEK